MKRLFFSLVLSFVAASPLAAQADVGQGAPRSTFAYVVADPESLLAFAGYDGSGFPWMEDMMAEGGEEAAVIFDYFSSIFLDASRVDIAFIDVAVGGKQVPVVPKFYFDITLGEGAVIDLAPEFLVMNVNVEEKELNGIALHEYSVMPGMPMVQAFQHDGHLYLCADSGSSVAFDLTLGLTQGNGDESLAAYSRFSDWYASRKGASIEVWFNTRELRSWIDRLVPAAEVEGFQQVDRYLDIRNWEQMLLTLDYTADTEKLDFAFEIKSRETIPALEKFNFPEKSFGLSRYIPSYASVAIGVHAGSPKGLKDRFEQDIRGMMGDERYEMTLKMIDQENSKLFGMDLDAMLKTFDGSVTFAMADNGEGMDMEEASVFVAFGLTDAEAAASALDHLAQHPEAIKEGSFEALDGTDYPTYLAMNEDGNFATVMIHESALLIGGGSSVSSSAAALDEMLHTVESGGNDSSASGIHEIFNQSATAVFGIDAVAFMASEQEQKIADSREFNTEAYPVFAPPVYEIFPNGLSFGMALTATKDTVRISATSVGARLDYLVAAGKGKRDDRYEYSEGQMRELYDAIYDFRNTKDAMPTSLDDLLKSDLITRAHLQSPFDPRFDDADMLDSWFDPSSDVAMAAVAKGFTSYTLVNGVDIYDGDSRILAYEKDANTAGGRRILYANGHVGWLHAEVWELALEAISAGEPVPEYDWGWDEKEEWPEEDHMREGEYEDR